MSAREEETRIPVFTSKETGFASVLKRMASSKNATCRALARYVHESNAQFISDPCDSLPLPSQLTPAEMLSECRKMEREHFPLPEGKAVFDLLTETGHIILSWPDQTKIAVLSDKGAPPSSYELQLAYMAARMSRQASLGQLAAEGGAACPKQ